LVDRTWNANRTEDIATRRAVWLDATISQNDTVTVTTITTLTSAIVVNKLTGATITSTIATNVVTITGACTNVLAEIFVNGAM